jgi:sugar phosphate isomerase/epimerase
MISVSHLTALDAPPEEFLSSAAAAGFEGVGLRIFPPKHAPHQWPVVGDRPRVAALRRQADDLGIQIFEAESFGIAADTQVPALRPALETAAELGASYVVSGGIDDDEERLVAGYAALSEAAQSFGLGMAIEFMPTRPMRSLVDAVRVLGKVAHPNAYLLIDALHLARSGGTPDDVAAIDPRTIAYVHLCDAPRELGAPSLVEESRAGRLYPGEGGLPLQRLMDLLPAEMPMSLEAPNALYAGLPPRERLRIAGEATLRFVAAMRARRRSLASAG